METKNSSAFFAIAALLVSCIGLSAWTSRRIPEQLILPLNRIDSQVAGWTVLHEQALDARTLEVLIPTSYLSRTYQKNGANLNLFIAYYAQQRAGESMHSPKHCLPGAGWEIWREASTFIRVNGQNIKINKDSIENLNARMLMFYWYQSKTRVIASEYMGKLLLARDSLGGHTAGSIVRITLPDTPGMEEEGLAFASRLIPEVQRCLGNQHISGSN